MYAISGSGSSIINSEGNHYLASSNSNAEEEMKRVGTDHSKWSDWNCGYWWMMAFCTTSGEGLEVQYERAYSLEPKLATDIDLITVHAGVLGVDGKDQESVGKKSFKGECSTYPSI